jgi:hypothetical protein
MTCSGSTLTLDARVPLAFFSHRTTKRLRRFIGRPAIPASLPPDEAADSGRRWSKVGGKFKWATDSAERWMRNGAQVKVSTQNP